MAYGTELFLGFRGRDKILATADVLKLKVDFDGPYPLPDQNAPVLDPINEKIKQAWFAAVAELGLEIGHHDGRGYPLMNTPTGCRKMSVWRFDIHYDPHGMNETPEHAILGVSLIGRYFPRFLDWRLEHGGSGEIITLNREAMRGIETAKLHIAKALSIFTLADIHIKELHY